MDHGRPRRSLPCPGGSPSRHRSDSQGHLGGVHQRRRGVGPASPRDERQRQLFYRPPGPQRGSRLRTNAALSRDPADLLTTRTSPNLRGTRALASAHPNPCPARPPPTAGGQAHRPPQDQRSPDQCAPACTASTKPATSAGATTSSESTAASPVNEFLSLPVTSAWPSTANKASSAG